MCVCVCVYVCVCVCVCVCVYVCVIRIPFTLDKTAGDSTEILLKYPLKCVSFNAENFHVTKYTFAFRHVQERI